MIQLAVVGARGRMGQLVVEAIKQDKTTSLCAVLSRADHQSLRSVTSHIDVVIDFTVPVATVEHAAICVDKGCGIVIGTTGFTTAELGSITSAANVIPIVLSPNMSVGINVSFKLLELAAKVLKGQAEIAILDVHHKYKKDLPSGTALKMSEVIKNACDPTVLSCDISSIRVGEIVGEHSALFSLEGERLEITHRAVDRSLFAKGALRAAKWLVEQKTGLYDMQDVLGFRHLT